MATGLVSVGWHMHTNILLLGYQSDGNDRNLLYDEPRGQTAEWVMCRISDEVHSLITLPPAQSTLTRT